MAAALCLKCGLCCDGTIFRDVKLVQGDDPIALKSLGLRRLRPGSKTAPAILIPPRLRFLQPCAALHGCRCSIYGSRPAHCRQFECLLFKKVTGRRVSPAEALRLVGAARRQAQKVRRLLRGLGDADEGRALGERFRRTTRRVEQARPNARTAELYGQLTLAFHDLNLLLQDEFYRPGALDPGVQPGEAKQAARPGNLFARRQEEA